MSEVNAFLSGDGTYVAAQKEASMVIQDRCAEDSPGSHWVPQVFWQQKHCQCGLKRREANEMRMAIGFLGSASRSEAIRAAL
jgi:hypothetical protein